MTRVFALLTTAAALLLTGCGGNSGSASQHTPASAPSGTSKSGGLPELTNMRQLQTAFDAHPGVPRLIILLSPT